MQDKGTTDNLRSLISVHDGRMTQMNPLFSRYFLAEEYEKSEPRTLSWDSENKGNYNTVNTTNTKVEIASQADCKSRSGSVE